ncbi:hypothetical protein AAF712_012387 [Marasmius tenuissimus]|uniref:Uncharacterized protein n=1 Tax=Marasmius tenuissimus TaxID=585030 RepID=A0ABR2ZHL7_9AGAR
MAARTRDSFFPLIAQCSMLIFWCHEKCQKLNDDGVAFEWLKLLKSEDDSTHEAQEQHRSWISELLHSFVGDLDVLRVGAILDGTKADCPDWLWYFREVNMPVYVYWGYLDELSGSPMTSPAADFRQWSVRTDERYVCLYRLAPGNADIDDLRFRAATKTFGEQQPCSSPLSDLLAVEAEILAIPLYANSGQLPGERVESYFKRQQEKHEELSANESLPQQQKRLQRERDNARKPCPGKKGPRIWYWEKADHDFRVRTLLSQAEGAGAWADHGFDQKVYNSFQNCWDICSDLGDYDDDDLSDGQYDGQTEREATAPVEVDLLAIENHDIAMSLQVPLAFDIVTTHADDAFNLALRSPHLYGGHDPQRISFERASEHSPVAEQLVSVMTSTGSTNAGLDSQTGCESQESVSVRPSENCPAFEPHVIDVAKTGVADASAIPARSPLSYGGSHYPPVMDIAATGAVDASPVPPRSPLSYGGGHEPLVMDVSATGAADAPLLPLRSPLSYGGGDEFRRSPFGPVAEPFPFDASQIREGAGNETQNVVNETNNVYYHVDSLGGVPHERSGSNAMVQRERGSAVDNPVERSSNQSCSPGSPCSMDMDSEEDEEIEWQFWMSQRAALNSAEPPDHIITVTPQEVEQLILADEDAEDFEFNFEHSIQDIAKVVYGFSGESFSIPEPLKVPWNITREALGNGRWMDVEANISFAEHEATAQEKRLLQGFLQKVEEYGGPSSWVASPTIHSLDIHSAAHDVHSEDSWQFQMTLLDIDDSRHYHLRWHDGSFSILVEDPVAIMGLVRTRSSTTCSDAAAKLFQEGVKFQTLAAGPLRDHAPSGNRDVEEYCMTKKKFNGPRLGYIYEQRKADAHDFSTYQFARNEFLRGRNGRAAGLAGGIVCRIAKEVLNVEDVIHGPEVPEVFTRGRCFFEQDGVGYWDDCLTEEDVDLICGVYYFTTGGCLSFCGLNSRSHQLDHARDYCHEKYLSSHRSWFPRPGSFNASTFNVGFWSKDCEKWYKHRVRGARSNSGGRVEWVAVEGRDAF